MLSLYRTVPDDCDDLEGAVTYCLGIMTHQGLVLASDSRTNAGYDDVDICRKMHKFVVPGERVFVLLCSGSLSLSQSVVTLLTRDFKLGTGLATAPTMYDAARVIGEQIRRVADIDRSPLERDGYRYNVHVILGGQIRGERPGLYVVYPQGNPLSAAEDSPYVQIGECKYGRPILDRGIRFSQTSLEEAAKYALISLDSTMRSNVTVGPPIDLVLYAANDLQIKRYRRFGPDDPDLRAIHTQWEQTLRKAVQELPAVQFEEAKPEPAKPEQVPEAAKPSVR
jgi:putative proteasome-type protease